MSAFTDWLALDSPVDRRVLAEIQLREELAGWTQDGTYTNCYKVAWASQVQTSVVPGGLFRTLAGVQMASSTGTLTTLALYASLSSLNTDAHADSPGYYYDASAGQLYVNVANGSNPDATALLMLVRFTIAMGTAPLDVVGGALYEPRITGTLPTLSYARNDSLFGVSISSSGSLDLANADGLFDALVRTWIWPHGTITWKLGGPALAFADYGVIGTSLIADAVPQDDVLRLELLAADTVLDATVPDTPIGAALRNGDAVIVGWPNASADVQATSFPWLLGRMDAITPIFVGVTDSVAFGVTEGHVVCQQTLATGAGQITVRATARSGGAVTPLTLHTDYEVEAGVLLVNGTTWPDANYTFEVDAQTVGPITGGMTAADAAALLLAGQSIDSASFTQAAADNASEVGTYVTTPTTKADLLRLIERSCLGRILPGLDGIWTMAIWDPSTDPTLWPTLQDEQIATWDAQPTVAGLVRGLTVSYTGGTVTVDQPRTAARYGVQDTAALETCLRHAVDAQAIGDRALLLAGSIKAKIRVTRTDAVPLTWLPVGRVMVTRRRAPGPGGTYNSYPLEIVAIEKSLASLTAVVTLQDTDGLGLTFKQLAPDALEGLTWAAATPAQRAQYGFFCTDAGYADPADLSSFRAWALW